MRWFPSDVIGAQSRPRTAWEPHSPAPAGLLFRIGLLLLIALGFALAVQFLAGAPY
jgi:hypothetical protein